MSLNILIMALHSRFKKSKKVASSLSINKTRDVHGLSCLNVGDENKDLSGTTGKTTKCNISNQISFFMHTMDH